MYCSISELLYARKINPLSLGPRGKTSLYSSSDGGGRKVFSPPVLSMQLSRLEAR